MFFKRWKKSVVLKILNKFNVVMTVDGQKKNQNMFDFRIV